MKKFIAIMMVLGLVGFAVAQDLDGPTMGTPSLDQGNGGAAAGVFDALVARVQAGEADVLGNRTRNWRGNYWEIWAWESTRTTESSFDMWGRFSGTDLDDAWGTYQEQQASMTAAEMAAIREMAGNAHQRIMAQGLN